MLIRQSKFTSTNYVSSFKSNKAWYQLSHSLASAALPLHADVAMVDQAEKPQMPIRHEWVIVSGGAGGTREFVTMSWGTLCFHPSPT